MVLIDREDVAKQIAELIPDAPSIAYRQGLLAAIQCVACTELVQVDRSGYWVGRWTDADGTFESCSVCGCDADITNFEGDSFSFCPHCGARMGDYHVNR